MVYLLALVSVLLSAVAQLAMKTGVAQSGRGQAESAGDWVGIALNGLMDWRTLAGLALYGTSAVIWLVVLAKLDLSKAYPIVGLGFVFTMLFGVLVLGEVASLTRILGTLFICAGVVLVARS